MTRLRILVAVMAVVLVPFTAQAGVWRACYPAASIQTGNVHLGTATATTNASGQPVIAFQAAGDQWATAPVVFPSYLTSISFTAQVYGYIASTTPSNNICATVGSVVTVTGAGGSANSIWLNNAGTALIGNTRPINPTTTSTQEITNSIPISFTPFVDVAGGSTCSSVGQCAESPAVVRVQRIDTGCANDDPGIFNMTELCIYGTTP